MNTQISRVRIVELMNESIEEAYREDTDLRWIAKFMGRLHEESPELAAAVVQAAKKKSKELNDKTI